LFLMCEVPLYVVNFWDRWRISGLGGAVLKKVLKFWSRWWICGAGARWWIVG